MKTFALMCLAVVLFALPARSQDVVPSIQASSKALLFSFSGFSFLSAGNFEGGIGGKYYLSETMAVRGGVQFASASQDVPANPATGQTGTDGEISASRFGVAGAVELHLSKGRVRPYVGGGLGFSTTSTESKNAVVGNPPPSQTTTKNRQVGESIGGVTYTAGSMLSIYGLAGVEFFLYKEISLAAEYRLGFSSISRPDQEVTSGTTTVTTKVGGSSAIGVNSAGVLTLAVYF
ncbi:MAG TPA: outer membrane beta-barrel protein [Bacteroidota bacterium]|nr:outer membrane beta-barrel protein [Bacteroidota bacterium]